MGAAKVRHPVPATLAGRRESPPETSRPPRVGPTLRFAVRGGRGRGDALDEGHVRAVTGAGGAPLARTGAIGGGELHGRHVGSAVHSTPSVPQETWPAVSAAVAYEARSSTGCGTRPTRRKNSPIAKVGRGSNAAECHLGDGVRRYRHAAWQAQHPPTNSAVPAAASLPNRPAAPPSQSAVRWTRGLPLQLGMPLQRETTAPSELPLVRFTPSTQDRARDDRSTITAHTHVGRRHRTYPLDPCRSAPPIHGTLAKPHGFDGAKRAGRSC